MANAGDHQDPRKDFPMQQPPNQQGYGPPHAQGYGPPPGYGGPPPKKGMSNGMIALIVVGCLFGGCTLLGAIGAATKKDQPQTTAATTTGAAEANPTTPSTPEPNAATPTFPWIATVKANCAAYKAAPNQIKKSATFRANQELLASTGVQNARGKLTTLSTNQGGSELTLTIKINDVEFQTEGLFAPIKQGSAVYNAAADMKEGQCVVFSARKLKAASMTEQAQVCDLDYFADFTSLVPCR